MSYLTACGRRCGLPGHQVQGGRLGFVCQSVQYLRSLLGHPALSTASQDRGGFGCLAQTALSQWGCCLD